MKPRFLVCLGVLSLLPLAFPATERKPIVHAGKLLELDDRLEAACAREHPQVLPRRPHADPRARAFDWSQHVTGIQVHSQGHTGTCWIHSVVAALEYNWHLRNGGCAVDLSPQPIIDRSQTIHGKPDGLAMDMLLQHGTADRRHYPFVGKVERLKENVPTPYRIVGWGRVAVDNYPSITEIKEAVARHGPVNAGIYAALPAFHRHRGDGVFREEHEFKEGDPIVTHSILIVGWDDEKRAWKIQNSWGTAWGDQGFAWVAWGCNHIGHQAEWLRAQCSHYQLPREAQRLAGEKAAPFPNWPHAVMVEPGR